MTTADLEALFLRLCESDPTVRVAFDDVVRTWVRALRRRDKAQATEAGMRFGRLLEAVAVAEGEPLPPAAMPVLMDIVGAAVLRQARAD